MSETPYLLSIRPGTQAGRNTCVWAVAHINRLESGLHVASPVLEAVGFCALQPGQPSMSREARILLDMPGPPVQVVRPPAEVIVPQLAVEGTDDVLANFARFSGAHPSFSVQAPATALPLDLALAFEEARIYVPGPLDGRTGFYA